MPFNPVRCRSYKSVYQIRQVSARLLPDAAREGEPLHLLFPQVPNDSVIFDARDAEYISAEVAGHKSKTREEIRVLENSLGALQKHEERMIPTDVVGTAVLYGIFPCAVGCPSMAVLDKRNVGKAQRLPSQHVRLHFIPCIPSRLMNESTNGVPALPPINLGGATDVEIMGTFRRQSVGTLGEDRAATQAELRILL